uniref:B-cell antigen receptor complex-associated protein alpha chain n=1 Tax=Semicossyphus pulcher TaxID=241346 RepID=UPI0037E930C6
MGTVANLLVCSFVVAMAQAEVTLEADVPFLKVQHKKRTELECCFTSNVPETVTWVRHVQEGKKIKGPNEVNLTQHITTGKKESCNTLKFRPAQLNDSGFYQCLLKGSKLFTHGTYLHVYKPLEKTIDLSENTKNQILTAEGVLLLLCVLLPASTLLFQSKRLTVLEQKKMRKEEENIYQGLNLDDCCATYDQIERSNAHGPYQDVCNIMEEEEDIQLEKP